jgi:hypothetical protein
MIAIEQLIKITLGVFVIVAVSLGLFFLGSYVGDFFDNVGGSNGTSGVTETSTGTGENVPSATKVIDNCGECGGIVGTSGCTENKCKQLTNCVYSGYKYWVGGTCKKIK